MGQYKLKKGVFVRQIGLPPLCEWGLTDELAEKYLQNDPSLKRFFDFIPVKIVSAPEKTKPEIIADEIIESPVNKSEPEAIIIKPKRKRPKTKK